MSLLDLLLETLEDLSSDKLMKFKWHLKHAGVASEADKEKANATTQIVDLVVARCGQERAGKITLDILRKMKENNLAEQLETQLKANNAISPTTGSEDSEKRLEEEKNMREPDYSLQRNIRSSAGQALNVAHNIKNNWSIKIEGGSNEDLPMFKLSLDETWCNSDGSCRRCTFGKNSIKQNKTIMMIGATGAGKTTLINNMINYILGVQWEDDFRFVLIDEGKQRYQAESQTSEITAYQINHMDGFQVPYSLTIVDTPGFGDTRGISHDQKITKQIEEFFSGRGGIDRIDAVCFVVLASLPRLPPTQKYIFDSILSIFGKDIAPNILLMVTFADMKTPSVLEAIKVSKVLCSINESGDPLHFNFNNSVLFANNKSVDDEESNCKSFDQMFWKLSFSSMKLFFTSLNRMNTKSLSLTLEVLKERQQLEVLLEGLQPQINAGLTKLEEIKRSQKCLERLQEIALKPNPLSTPDYIDPLIESEKLEAKPGFQDRIQSLMEVRKKAEIISKVSTGTVLPHDWQNYKPETRKK